MSAKANAERYAESYGAELELQRRTCRLEGAEWPAFKFLVSEIAAVDEGSAGWDKLGQVVSKTQPDQPT
jgi:hypothetical protein